MKTTSGFQNFILKALQTALIADQAFELAKTQGASTLLQQGNFDSLLTELATVFAPPV